MSCSEPGGSVAVAIVASGPSSAVALLRRMDAPGRWVVRRFERMTFTEIPTQPRSLPLAGKRVYSAGAIATYTVLANLPVGCVLYGLNMQSRGARTSGRLLIAVGIVGGIALFSAAFFGYVGRFQSRLLTFLALFSAYSFYKFEKQPVRAALQNGAGLARWWLPALYLVGIYSIYFGIAYFIP